MSNEKVYENVEQVYEVIQNNRLAVLTRNKEGKRGKICDTDMTGFHFANLDLSYAIFNNVNLTGAVFTSCNLSSCMFINCKNDNELIAPSVVLNRCIGNRVYVKRCDFSHGITVDQSKFTDLEVEDTIIDGINLTSTEIYAGEFYRCKLMSVGMRYNLIADTSFDRSTIDGVASYGAVKQSKFNYCDVSCTIWSNIDLSDICFFESDIYSMILRGCTVKDIECIDCDHQKFSIADSSVFGIKFDSYKSESEEEDKKE